MKHILSIVILLSGVLASFGIEHFVFFGTYTGAKSNGIYVSRFDSASGKISEPELAVETKSPNFLAVDPTGRFLYAVGEMTVAPDKRVSSVDAFKVDAKTGKLSLLNQQASRGGGPCHVSVDATGKCVMVANYGSGSIASYPVCADGSLNEASTTIQHTGSSVIPGRQSGPHAHVICPSPDNRFALTCDLGLDKVLVYQLDAAKAKLTPNNPPFYSVAPGSGPRHLAFSQDGKFVYVINEMKLTITVFAYDTANATMTEVQTISTLPPGISATERDSTAEVADHPSGKFVYGSNRGHDSIAVFTVDAKTGKLTLVQNESTQGKTPRHFAIDPSGGWLLAENQNSDSVVVFAIDRASGKLKPTGQTITLGSPVCAAFVVKNL